MVTKRKPSSGLRFHSYWTGINRYSVFLEVMKNEKNT